jgi:hypothetical protein
MPENTVRAVYFMLDRKTGFSLEMMLKGNL